MSQNRAKVIKSIDDLPKGDYFLNKKFDESKSNAKNDIYIPKKLFNQFIILIYENNQTRQDKEAWVLVDETVDRDLIKKIVPKIRAGLKTKQINMSFCVVKGNKELIKGLRENAIDKDSNIRSEDNETRKQVDEIFENAVKNNASDIHIEVDDNNARIRVRINGDLVPYGPSIFKEKGESYARMIYQVNASEKGGQADTEFNPSRPQDGVFEQEIDGKRIRVRIASMPIFPRGFQMVCRILVDDSSKKQLTLEDLGYSFKEISDIERMNANSEGAIIIAGVTGSGKSTTLKTLIEKKIVDREFKIKVITIEDPPEYTIKGAQQVPITRDAAQGGVDAAKKAYLKTMEAAVRSDPDVIMIGEVRDTLSANTLRSATESGHGVFATVHAPGIFNIIGRLQNFELDDAVITSPKFISGLVYQKLIKKVCSHCSIPLKDGNKVPQQNNYADIIIELVDTFTSKDINLVLIKDLEDKVPKGSNIVRFMQDLGYINSKEARRVMDTFNEINNEEKNLELFYRILSVCDKNELKSLRFRGDGCKECSYSGYEGRMVCAETLVPDEKILEILASGNIPKAKTYWKRNLNGRTANEDAIFKMKRGLVDPRDVENIFTELGKS